MLKIPDLSMLMSWLNKNNIDTEQCIECHGLHLPHLKKMDDVLDAKVELTDNIIYFSLSSEIRPSAITSLITELSQINLSSIFVKAYLDISDDQLPKIIFRHVVDCNDGITENQFISFITNVEDEVLQIISELNNYDLLSRHKLIKDELESLVLELKTLH